MNKPPFKPLEFAPAQVERSPLPSGGFVLRSSQALQPPPKTIGHMLATQAQRHPDHTFLAQRRGDDWQKLSYSEAWAMVPKLGASLLARGLSAERPLAILSPNSINAAMLTLGAMHVGVPAASVSVAYALLSKDHAKLKSIFAQLQPGLCYAPDARFQAALDATGLAERILDEDWSSLLNPNAQAQAQAERASQAVGPDTIAKLLFTSGSTGAPKGVLNTQRMLTSNQQAIAQLWPFLAKKPPVVLDWLPWSHTFGANHNFHMILMHGGTLYIDDGKPVPGAFERSIENLKRVAPTLYFNVPRGFDMLLQHLEADPELRDHFFSQLDLIFYAGAALPASLWSRLERCSIDAQKQRVIMLSAWGSTETAPMATTVHFPIEQAGVIGLPAPGTEIKMVPSGQKLELRVRGPNVSPGYWRQPELSAQAFDEEGFFKMGDAGKLLDPERPERGIVFDGRTAENFKLTSGTWVLVGELKGAIITACAPVVQDVVVTGHDRDDIGALIFLSGEHKDAIARIRAGIEQHNQNSGGQSRVIKRALIMEAPPSIDAGEITDKGYINQRAVLEARADLVQRLYSGQDVLLF